LPQARIAGGGNVVRHCVAARGGAIIRSPSESRQSQFGQLCGGRQYDADEANNDVAVEKRELAHYVTLG
jgi:hypothetical protein